MNFTPRKLKSEIKVTHITALWVFNVYKRLRMWEANRKIGKGWDKNLSSGMPGRDRCSRNQLFHRDSC